MPTLSTIVVTATSYASVPASTTGSAIETTQSSSGGTISINTGPTALHGGAIAGITIGVAVVLFKLTYAIIYCSLRRQRQRRMNEKMSTMIASRSQMAELSGSDRLEISGRMKIELPRQEEVTELHSANICELSSAYPCSEKSVEPDDRWAVLSPYAGDIAKR